MKQILVKAYLANNLGDDLFLKVLFDRYPNIRWIIEDIPGKKYDMLSSYENVFVVNGYLYKVLRKLKLEYLYYKNYDSVLYIGGSIFMEIDDWEQQYRNRKRIFEMFKSKPIFILGANFGPYNDNKFFLKYFDLFKKCVDICFREKYSFKLFNELKNIRVAPDIVFQLKGKNLEKRKNSVGISLINLKDEEQKKLRQYSEIYNKKIKELVEYFIDNGKNITFFSFCEKQGDLLVINEILEEIDEKYKVNIEVMSYNGDIDGFLNKFESMENILGTRFHACILSQVFNQGLYPIIYSNKTINVLKDIGLNNEYIHINEIENLDPVHVLNKINNNKIKNDNKIFEDSEKQFEVLDRYVTRK